MARPRRTVSATATVRPMGPRRAQVAIGRSASDSTRRSRLTARALAEEGLRASTVSMRACYRRPSLMRSSSVVVGLFPLRLCIVRRLTDLPSRFATLFGSFDSTVIRTEILQGNIQHATALINSFFPAFFTPPEDGPAPDAAGSYTSSPFGKPVPTATATAPTFSSFPGASAQASAPKQDGMATATTAASHPPPLRLARPLPFISARPSFLHLNLLIQAFVETIRTVPVGPPATAFAPAGSGGGRRSASPALPPSGNGALTAMSSPASSIHSASSTVSATSSSALAQAKALHLAIDQLQEGSSKEWYQSVRLSSSCSFACKWLSLISPIFPAAHL